MKKCKIGGNIIDFYGVNVMLITGSISAAVGTILLLFVLKPLDNIKTVGAK